MQHNKTDTASFSDKIIYEDSDVIVFNKPCGMLSQGSESEKGAIEIASEIAGCDVLYPVHRLDRMTCGVMIAAKNSRAAAALSALIMDGYMHKEYYAVVKGVPDEKSGILEDMLFFDRRADKSYVVKSGSKRRGAKDARLEYSLESVSRDGKASLISIRLFTGRTHQIRVQFGSRKHPLLGDGKYGGGDNKCKTALCSCRITFDTAALKSGYFGGRDLISAVESGTEFTVPLPEGYPWNLF